MLRKQLFCNWRGQAERLGHQGSKTIALRGQSRGTLERVCAQHQSGFFGLTLPSSIRQNKSRTTSTHQTEREQGSKGTNITRWTRKPYYNPSSSPTRSQQQYQRPDNLLKSSCGPSGYTAVLLPASLQTRYPFPIQTSTSIISSLP